MKKNKNNSADASELRRRAEAKLRADTAKASQTRTEASTQRIVHELKVYQIELEMQNEELDSHGPNWRQGWSATPTSMILHP